ncbi:MAG: tRNA (adenosine(37)-N6)-dimethylallyltransferase MiaA [Candidatus Taylorbacteria bacterium CG11_big_fil_rev_8_21_14_0_20_46_11]|uniref:tRNA dimethylallyltransferase n=1 Tax=Candidatus Taylorbacteria bacterium CG11_big_fil_rev_8_21_14_0_20_46_11 TaxID=1975025 RepID=A0A2H0KA56_9BACT|nr:MAG: tRNA (adenosine(37)-N6)-dimethylallyltransferase MiaA [Candidatus Taylorbacteria bacterium CG11_big_fil_rev_8_21_14_0_20_46_11]
MVNSVSTNKVLVLIGPTAVGKSSLAISLAKQHDGEVISADSRQVYIGLDIGTGKVTTEEMDGVPHHLLDVADSKEQFTASDFQRLGKKALADIHSRGRLPIICGGTGLYVQAIVNDVLFPEVPPNLKLRKKLETKAAQELFEILEKLDARRAKDIDPHNTRRLVRAIEIATELGKVPPHKNSPRTDINPLYIGLTLLEAELKKRIASRLQSRINDGMLKEAKNLHTRGLTWKRMEDLGLEYRYMSRHLRGLISQEEMIAQLQSEIWRYAKRQMTWFRRNADIRWFKPTEIEKIKKIVKQFLQTSA